MKHQLWVVGGVVTQRHWSREGSAEGMKPTWFPRVGANTSCKQLPQCRPGMSVSGNFKDTAFLGFCLRPMDVSFRSVTLRVGGCQ